MSTFYHFPHTPHLAWLGSAPVRDDKVFTPQEAKVFLDEPVAIEEKVDGANLGFSLSPDANLRIQKRGDYLQQPYQGQFSGLNTWLDLHGADLEAFLQEPEHQGLILFGEWCAARHSVAYTHLPDLFLLFDVADPQQQRFWSCIRRNEAANLLGLATVPLLQDKSHHTINGLRYEIDHFRSRYHPGPPEGVILRHDGPEWCTARAKLVRPDFTQAIGEHWSSRPIEWNGIDFILTA
ncbi:MAG: RNA ligase family protein [Cyanobacteriota bacterium]|jgi:ATP-dependent RNA circularization protein (DNA/RNA ligase family)